MFNSSFFNFGSNYSVLLLIYNIVSQQTRYIKGTSYHQTHQEYVSDCSAFINKTLLKCKYQEVQ